VVTLFSTVGQPGFEVALGKPAFITEIIPEPIRFWGDSGFEVKRNAGKQTLIKQ